MELKNPRKICVMHQASIGDTLLATPVYRAIKKKYPSCKLVVVTSHVGMELLNDNPYIDEMIPYQKGDSAWKVIRTIWRADAAIILDYHYRNALYAFLAMIPQRIGRGKDFINRKVHDDDPLLYEPLKDLHVAAVVGADSDDVRLTPLSPTKDELSHVRTRLASIQNDGQKLVIVVPHSLSPLKDWEPEKYRELICRFQHQGWAVVMLGGKNERSRIAEEYPMAVNMAGDLSLRESAVLIASADLQISGCTAMLHVCATTDTPSIALYGPTVPEQWAPKRNCHVITKRFPCAPCYSTGRECGDNRCIRAIQVDDVWDAIKEMDFV